MLLSVCVMMDGSLCVCERGASDLGVTKFLILLPSSLSLFKCTTYSIKSSDALCPLQYKLAVHAFVSAAQ